VAVDIFAKIDGIKGESLDVKHKDEVEMLSWSWGVTQSGSVTAGAGGGAGKATFNDFSFTHNLDKASPRLLKACATGEHIKEATIAMRKAGGEQLPFLTFKLKDIIIISVQPSATREGSAATTEQVTLQFAKVDLEYRPQKADGSLDAGIHFRYDIKKNKEG
jgi:type VI secretion system secreted protein Hcp